MSVVALYKTPTHGGLIKIYADESSVSPTGFEYSAWCINQYFLVKQSIDWATGDSLSAVESILRENWDPALELIPNMDLGSWILYVSPRLDDNYRMISLQDLGEGCGIITANQLVVGDRLFNSAQAFVRFWKGDSSIRFVRTGVFQIVSL